jgi:GNAT superfamily N-acetyltransferase
METADVPAAATAFEDAFAAMRAAHGLPAIERSDPRTERLSRRMHHFLSTDPGGSWVAEEAGAVRGLSQAFVREGLWVLSLLAVSPGAQAGGAGRRLLEHALDHHGRRGPALIQCSRDPRAMALYARAGFGLHPGTGAFGPMRRRPIAPEGLRLGTADDLDTVAEIDRAVRGAGRTVDLRVALGEPGTELLLDEDRAYALVVPDRVTIVAGVDPAAAARVLRGALARTTAPAVEVNWITGPQQWAVEVVVAAGIELHPHGPVMVRGLPGPPAPYLPSGGWG